jgi:hypothetical protein
MEALLIEYAKTYGMEKAMEMLGLDQQSQNPKYAISFGGKNFDLKNMVARTGINSLMGGNLSSILGPAALFGGAFMLGRAFDPMRPGSRNYSPNLRGQLDYLSGLDGMLGRNESSGLMQYGKNVASMFGSNNYQTALDNKISYFENRIKQGKPISEKNYEKALKEKADFFEHRADVRDKAKTRSTGSYSAPTGKDIHGGGGNTGGSPGSKGPGGSDEMGSFRRGGIASL